MEDDVARPAEGFHGARDQVFPALTQHLDRDIIGNPVFVDQTADEVEFDLGSGRKSDFDLLEADPDEHVEVLDFLIDIHRDGERLIAVA